MKEMREYLKATKSSFITGACIVGWIVAKIAGAMLSKSMGLSIAVIIAGSILKIIENLFLAISMATILYVSIVIIKSRGPSGKRIAITGFFVLFAIVHIVLDYKVISRFTASTRLLDSGASKAETIVREKLEKSTKKESLSKLSYLKAEHAFVYEDKLETYLEANHTERKFVPNLESRRYKESHLLWQATSKYIILAMTVIIVVTIISTLVAIYLGITRKTKITNQP